MHSRESLADAQRRHWQATYRAPLLAQPRRSTHQWAHAVAVGGSTSSARL